MRRTLQLVLTQLGLAYFVEDGILVITGEDSAVQGHLPPSMADPAPILDNAVEKAERGELTSSEMKELIEVIKLQRQLLQLKHGKDGESDEGRQAKANPTRRRSSSRRSGS